MVRRQLHDLRSSRDLHLARAARRVHPPPPPPGAVLIFAAHIRGSSAKTRMSDSYLVRVTDPEQNVILFGTADVLSRGGTVHIVGGPCTCQDLVSATVHSCRLSTLSGAEPTRGTDSEGCCYLETHTGECRAEGS